MIYLINTITSWDEPPRARHQVAQALAKNHKVYFIARNEFGIPKLTWNVINPNLTVIEPYFPVDYRIRYRMPVINEIYQNWLFRKLSPSFKKPRVINFDHTATQIFKYFNDVIYYCNDYYIRGYFLYAIKKYLIKSETEVIKQANFCIATSQYLLTRLKRYNSRVYEIKLGAPEVKIPVYYKSPCKKINVGLVSFVDSKKVSISLIKEIIKNKNIELIIWGPVKEEFRKKFALYTNIHFRRSKFGEELYNDLLEIDVGIVPYLLNDDNPGRTPNKLWLYLALGKPVVITNIPNIRTWKFEEKIIYRVNSDAEFFDKILLAQSENSEELMRKRINVAKQNTWDKRVEQLIKIYNSYS